MKTQVFNSFILLFLLFSGLTLSFGQNEKPDTREKIGVYPANPTPYDSIHVVYGYMSSDGCPDYYLKLDSVIGNKMYVNKHAIENPPGFCAQVLRDFATRVNLGLLPEGTEIYFAEKLLSTIQFECKLNRIGVVVEGIDGCTGQLFVREFSPDKPGNPLYSLKDIDLVSSGLKPGDKVRFGANLIRNQQDVVLLCPVAGHVACVELMEPVSAYILKGNAMAGTDELFAGRAILFRKGERKAWAFSTIYNGKYAFANVPEGSYTIYVIPDRSIYRSYIPTFFVDKVKFSDADYIRLVKDTTNITVLLQTIQTRTGKGRVHGNLYYESDNLRDSVLSEKRNINQISNNLQANDIPVILMNSKNQPVAWTLSDVDGNYEFNNLELDTYKVVSETPSALAETVIYLNQDNTDVSADMMLRSPEAATSVEIVMQNLTSIYPNPVINRIYIESKESEEVILYNSMGQQIRRKMVMPGLNSLDLSDLTSGVIYIKTNSGVSKIIKK